MPKYEFRWLVRLARVRVKVMVKVIIPRVITGSIIGDVVRSHSPGVGGLRLPSRSNQLALTIRIDLI